MLTKCPACQNALEAKVYGNDRELIPNGLCILEKALCKESKVERIGKELGNMLCAEGKPQQHINEEPKPVIQTDNNCNPKTSTVVDKCGHCGTKLEEASYDGTRRGYCENCDASFELPKPLPPIEKLPNDCGLEYKVWKILNIVIERLNKG